MDNNNICRCSRCDGVVHEIVAGDTLYSLGRYYNVSVSQIIKANRGINPYNLMIGDKLCIPMNRYRDYDNSMNENKEAMSNSWDMEDTEDFDIEFTGIKDEEVDREMLLDEILSRKGMTLGKFAEIIKNL